MLTSWIRCSRGGRLLQTSSCPGGCPHPTSFRFLVGPRAFCGTMHVMMRITASANHQKTSIVMCDASLIRAIRATMAKNSCRVLGFLTRGSRSATPGLLAPITTKRKTTSYFQAGLSPRLLSSILCRLSSVLCPPLLPTLSRAAADTSLIILVAALPRWVIAIRFACATAIPWSVAAQTQQSISGSSRRALAAEIQSGPVAREVNRPAGGPRS